MLLAALAEMERLFRMGFIGILLVILSLMLAGCGGPVQAGSIITPSPEIASSTPATTPALMAILHRTAASEPTRPSATTVPTDNPPPTSTPSPDPTATISPSPPPSEITPFSLCTPVATIPLDLLTRYISDPYRPPPPGSDERHEGVDFSYYHMPGVVGSIEGVTVQSVLPGRVASAVADSFPYGNFVIVETQRESLPEEIIERLKIPLGQSLYLAYVHLLKTPLVSLGQEVVGCQQLGQVGATGNTDAPHLHFETRLGPAGGQFPVMKAFVTGVTAEERQYYILWRTSGLYNHFDPMLLLAPIYKATQDAIKYEAMEATRQN
ncbi:MAG: M23 family metallopeptidase [Anaerolineales bacterium]|nr:M23 family metallopeptidase [Anaerolineales bacterium]